MTFNATKAKVGDFLCYSKKAGVFDPIGAFIAIFSADSKRINGKFVHIACYSKDVGQKHYKIEHHIKSGIQEVELLVEDWENIKVLRYPFRSDQIGLMLQTARSWIGTERGKYDENSFPSMGIRSSVGKWLNWKWLRKGTPILNDLQKTVCSSLWSTIAHEILCIDIFKNVHYSSVIPEDYAGNTKMRRVS